MPSAFSIQLRLAVVLVVTHSTSALPAADTFGPLPDDLGWPAPTRESRPWARWWWLGSAVDTTNLTRLLTLYREAGLGGLEICPIYGVKGAEDRFIPFLSPRWVEMLAHTTREAKRLDLGIDLTTGSGWPFGGPNVSAELASAKVALKRYDLTEGGTLNSPLPEGRLQCLIAISDSSEQTNLTARVASGRLDWTAPPGRWRLYAVSLQGPVQKVKRAAPGGEGNVLDPYSVEALNKYLSDFDKAFEGYTGERPRSQFHDSFEYYNAQWTPNFLGEFQARRGYDLRAHLPMLFGEGPEETVARVKADYRETISDLHLAYVRRWTEWCHEHGSLSRNQAHGSPGNLVDHYAAADIAETEVFGAVAERNIPMNKFASSATHLTGRQLTSAESFTWLNEHFHASLSEAKQAADFLFLSGVNHILFHGIPYSPQDAPWPGWQFYASVNLSPEGGLWHDLPFFNAYLTRCQSILQSGAPANDVLLYFPFHDLWQKSTGLMELFAAPGRWMESHSVYGTAMTLWNRGYAFDHLSDHLLAGATCEKGLVVIGGRNYRVIVVPRCRVMPESSLRKLTQLADSGATILVQDQLPDDVPGFGNLVKRRAAFRELVASIKVRSTSDRAQGGFLVGTNVENLLQQAAVPREACVDAGLRFVRRAHAEGHHYFIAHRGERPVDGWVTLGLAAKSAVILDPRFEDGSGVATLRQTAEGATQVYLQLQPGQSCIVRTFATKEIVGPAWNYFAAGGTAQPVAGRWKVEFVQGGPELPDNFQTRELASWSTLSDAKAKRFAGTARYTLSFEWPAGEADEWLLDLGRVCESARVRINGHNAGAVWSAPTMLAVGTWLRPGTNTLEVEVTNLAANRIADLDQRKVNWKYFHDINVVNKQYKPLDASTWPPVDSGLLGPVTLKRMSRLAR